MTNASIFPLNFAPTLKSLTLLCLTTLSLGAAVSQADNGYGNPNPWGGPAMNANPWTANPMMHQARLIAVFKQRQAELDQRQDAQMQRILGGLDSGKLTSREAAALLREHLDIASQERSYLSDGRLGAQELKNLEQRLDEAERHITFEKRDREHAGDRGRSGDLNRPGELGRQGVLGYQGDGGRH
jgi:hypothetical protein